MIEILLTVQKYWYNIFIRENLIIGIFWSVILSQNNFFRLILTFGTGFGTIPFELIFRISKLWTVKKNSFVNRRREAETEHNKSCN